MCRELLRRGEHVEIYTTNVDGRECLDVPLGEPVEVQGVQVTYFGIQGSHFYKCSLAMAAALRTRVKSYDLLHINSLYQFPSTAAAYFARHHGVPYILRPHGTLDPYLFHRHIIRKRLYESLFERRNLAGAAAVYFTTDEEMKLARLSGLTFNGVVIPLGVDSSAPLHEHYRKSDLFPAILGTKTILFLGRINFKKGLDILCRAFGTLVRERNDVHLLIAGPDNDGYGMQVRRWLAEEKVLDKVTFAGMMTGHLKEAAMAASAIFVLPSYTENFGLAVVEAMAAGLPVVVSNRVNIWREVEKSHAGIVVDTEATELTKAMNRLLDDPHLARQMGENGKQLAARYSWTAVCDRLLELHEEITAKHSP
jgi:glycosyltransferase involved in cell wall biosynthesis